MGTRILKDNQTLIDAALLAYGRIDGFFQFMLDNEEALINEGEIDLSITLEIGQELTFDETNDFYQKDVIKALGREPIEMATKSELKLVEVLEPLILTTSSIELDQIVLSWDDIYTTETGFLLQEEVNGEWVDKATLPENQTNYTDIL